MIKVYEVSMHNARPIYTLLQWIIQLASVVHRKFFWKYLRNISWNISRQKISRNFTSLLWLLVLTGCEFNSTTHSMSAGRSGLFCRSSALKPICDLRSLSPLRSVSRPRSARFSDSRSAHTRSMQTFKRESSHYDFYITSNHRNILS